MYYKILSNFKRDRRVYVAGEGIELPETEETKQLVLDGVLEIPKKEEPEIPQEPENTETEEEIDLEGLSFQELKDLAEDKGIEIKGIRAKAKLIKVLKKSIS